MLSRDELICIASGCLMIITALWLLLARRRRTRRVKQYTGAADLAEPLINDEAEESGRTYAIKSRTRLALRQLACYAAARAELE